MLVEGNESMLYHPLNSKASQSTWRMGAAVAMVFGLVICVGVSSSASSFFAIRSPVQTASSVTPMTGTVVPSAVASTRHSHARSALKSGAADMSIEAEAKGDNDADRGFGLPLVLAGLSVTLLGIASWIVRPRQHVAMAFTSGSRSQALYAAKDGAVAEVPLKVDGPVAAMLTPLGYYEAYELVVAISPRLSDLEKEDRLATLEVLFTENKCKKVEKLDRGRRLLTYPIKGCIEAYIILYTFKGPRTMPKLINDWFVGPGLNSDGNVFRCFLQKQRRVKKGAAVNAQGEEDIPMWTV